MITVADSDTVVIRSERLAVRIAHPGTIYAGSRFDWTGFITQVILDGQHSFCTLESLDPTLGSGGRGLCNEFGIEAPIGFADARTGQSFPKIGIGLLTKPDDGPYAFFRPYLISPFDFSQEHRSDCLIQYVAARETRGYAMELTKTIRVAGPMLEMVYQLTNTGNRPFSTTEYNHNFISLDGEPLGPDYSLLLPDSTVPNPLPVPLTRKDGTLGWNETPKDDFYFRTPGFSRSANFSWELRHGGRRIGLRESNDFPIKQFALWGRAHVVSPEVFIGLALAPSDTVTWCRRHEFFSW